MNADADNLACPIDGLHLSRNDRQLICERGHSYDIARQGYVNLLPVQHKRSKNPGDSKAMVLARTQFLNAGYYQPVADHLCEQIHNLLVTETTPDNTSVNILDAGCGEGYYMDYLFRFLTAKRIKKNISYIGLDISKDAVIQASKRNKEINWIVGTNRSAPVTDSSIDIIICMFGFVSYQNFSRILKPEGKLVLVDPAPLHLKELRKIIYKNDRQKESKAINAGTPAPALFSLVSQKNLLFKETLVDNQMIQNLLLMTPHFFRADSESREQACKLAQLEITVDVCFKILNSCK